MPFYTDQVSVLFSAEQLRSRVAELGEQLTRDYQHKELAVVSVLKGSCLFVADLVRAIDLPLSVDFLGLSSYDGGTETSGVVRITSDLSRPIQGKHVLVVEDNVSNFVLIARMLGYLGIHCEWKTSGYEVVEYADTLPHLDLILMDIRLPYEDGYQALRKIRSHPRLSQTRVVAVTAEASEEEMIKAQSAGFDGFLGKPLDPDRFPEQIRRILQGEEVWEWR